MHKKKIFILAYAKANLGDDLFIYMLAKKYPNIQFEINIENEEHSKIADDLDNIIVIRDKERNITKQNATDYDGYIYIGGSIFMEGGVIYNLSNDFLKFMKECKANNIPFFYISSNFGPYTTEQYYNLAKETFANCTDICFRDKYSYNLFKDIPSVRYAPDLVFSIEPKENKKEEGTVGISVIDFDIRNDLKKYEESYIKTLADNIIDYINQDKKVYLFSFCKYEGDEKGIDKILAELPKKYLNSVEIVKYQGDIEKFLEKYSNVEYMICTRFHAMVLSVVFEQKCKVMSYSKKIDRVVEDLQLFDTKNIIQLKEMNEKIKIPLDSFDKVSIEHVLEIRKKAKEQLKKFELKSFTLSDEE